VIIGVEQVAQVCHEANRAYCQSIGDFSQREWNAAPKWQQQSAIEGVKFHLQSLEAGVPPSPAASHESWLREKEREGWVYGPVKDIEAKTHPCMVPYTSLPLEQQLKDYIFAGIVEAFFLATPA